MSYVSKIEYITLGGEAPKIEAYGAAVGFGSGTTIDGHIAIPVPAGAVGFGAGGVEVDGYKTIVSSLDTPIGIGSPGTSSLSFEAIIDVSGSSIGLGSTGVVASPGVTAKATAVGFGAPGISIDGYKAIVTADATTVGFKSSGKTTIIVADAPEVRSGYAVFPTNTAVGLGSLTSAGVFTAVGPMEAQLPRMDFRAESFSPTSSMELQFPKISFDAYVGESLTAEFPLFQIEISLSPGIVQNINTTIPALRLEMLCGSNIRASMPIFDIEIKEVYNHPVDFAGFIPKVSMFLEGSSENLSALGTAFPEMYLTLKSKSINGYVDGALRGPRFSASLLVGVKTGFNGEIPILQLSTKSIVTGDDDLVAALCSPQLYIQSGELGSEVLRYIKRKVR